MSRGKLEDEFSNKNALLQMQQKIIHYRSEVTTYLNKLKKCEQDLEKEKIRTQYLQEKLYEMETTNLESYEKEIASLQMKLLASEVALEEEKKRVQIMQEKLIQATPKIETQEVIIEPEPLIKMQSFFNYSLLYTSEEEIIEEVSDYHQLSIIGDFIIENSGTAPLHQLIVCIRLTPINVGHISGKIATKRLQSDNQTDDELPEEEWHFVHENWKEKIKKNGEYWIQYIKSPILQPNETLKFSNFELTLKKPKEQNSVVIEAFSYCKELPNGIPSLNKIILNL